MNAVGFRVWLTASLAKEPIFEDSKISPPDPFTRAGLLSPARR
ncbi:hypothetical protein BN873_150191 [Candidatus Competibacter denitrificans Run_A_D11]|uniref:Uncharacterized protein n=1 Tax=Candidatus Competibacter denitrificans Run_A_D11 TaxID=1400863 RepID=W6MBM5_9GAMM|nr:hypothetical protein BN873_150191 [Candidatus Competibacter denitrificans Run_A_D11]